jgi:glycerol-3-phosphate dehydrogenase
MDRAVQKLTRTPYDVVVVGGGIYGVHVARDAALRGLRVALIEQEDFGSGTSGNSHKIIHGGLRYLQHADFRRMREAVRERTILFRTAPHLVQPMPVLIPLYRHRPPGLFLMSLALRLNDLLSFDRNRGLEGAHAIGRGRIVSREDCLRLCPGLSQERLIAGALFYDGQVSNPERLILSLAQSASVAGADLANYVQVTGLLKKDNAGVAGVRATDVLTGNDFEVRANIVVNCTGPWSPQLLHPLGKASWPAALRWLKAMVLITRPVVGRTAVGVPCPSTYRDEDAVVNKGYRNLFITPWRDASLIGTFQAAYDGDIRELRVEDEEIDSFIAEINQAFPSARLTRADVRWVHCGLLPRSGQGNGNGEPQLLKQFRIHDHADREGIDGLISVVGVKYTTARGVAEKAVDLVFRKLRKPVVPSRTAAQPVYGGNIGRLDQLLGNALAIRQTCIDETVIRSLVYTYGSTYRDLLAYGNDDSTWLQPVIAGVPVIRAQVVHGVREEMAQKLSDTIFRRTGLGAAGYPGDECLETCAKIMAAELNWDGKRIRKEIEDTQRMFESRGCLIKGDQQLCASL